ncbi:glycosyltransferase family 87 protein [Pedobacter sp. MC2016-15]|uniref:glycosyltransferase family 87 protein n=1 Tax=Pedobacter sp. MC2016-15 TaxID=2994473 RepID=UPI002245F694|nr:glycosyltransferase family 87 protein [Pedobacter sp. MC2016-15]MCX2478887.1 glycosyltransferase family 87 protein [Pedobacter sp. MC2016-15]
MAHTLQKVKTINLIQWLSYVLILCTVCSLTLVFSHSWPNGLSMTKLFLLDGTPYNADSWGPMISALKYIKGNLGDDVYDALFLKGVKFQYPLTSLLLFDLPSKFTGLSYDQLIVLFNLISRISVFGTALLTAHLLLQVLKRAKGLPAQVKPYNPVVLYGLVMLLTLMFYPLIQSYLLGQIQTLLTFLTTLAILCWLQNRKVAVGIIIGFICLIKPQLGLLLVWALLRREWKMFIPAAVVVSIFGAISLAMYGFKLNFEYFSVLSYLSHHGESYYVNQSVNGLMNRITFNGANLEWDQKFPAYSPLVYYVTLVSSLAFIGYGLFAGIKNRKPHVIEFCLAIMCITMASPIAWEHHYAILLPIFVVMSPFVCYYYQNSRKSLLLLAFGFLLITEYFEFVKVTADTPFNFLQSYLFFGACIMLYYLAAVAKKITTPGPVEVPYFTPDQLKKEEVYA